MKSHLPLLMCGVLLSSASFAQFTGPSESGQMSTVEQAHNASINTYVTINGHIVSHLREDYYTFRDESGDIRVEIPTQVWQNRRIGPETQVRLIAEVDRTLVGTRYLWVKSLEPVE